MQKTTFAVAMVTVVKATHIVYRDDLDISEYRPARTEFDFAFNWPEGNPGCGATMVSPWHFVTAAHCLTDTFEAFDIVLKGETYGVVEQRPNDCYDVRTGLPNPADVAIMVLDRPIPNAVEGDDYLKVYDGSDKTMEGEVFTLVGWGNSGPVGTSGD